MTAIAAVLALTSTPLSAQETTTPPDPVSETPADPPPVADPLAPEPAEPAAAEPEASEAAPAETAAPATTRRAASRARATTTNRAPSEPVRSAAPASAPPAADPVAETMPAPPPVAAPVAEAPAPPIAEPAPASNDILAENALPLAAAGGLGLLALAGIGLAARSRRRRREREHFQANQQYLDEHAAEPTPEPEPVRNDPSFIRPANPVVGVAAPVAAVKTDAPRTRLPEDFDLSRFGPHVRAAYQGPTADNPSLSLKYRLRRAAAMDQRAKLEGQARPQVEAPARRPEPARQQPAWASNDEGFMLRRAGGGQRSKPANVTTRH